MRFLPKSLCLRVEIMVMLLSIGTSACRLPVAQEDSLVSNLKFQPEAFDSFTASTSLRYSLARPATTTIRILTANKAEPVITLFEELKESRGLHEHTWLGDTEEGYFAPSGSYIGVLEVEGQKFESVVRIYHR